MKPFKYAPARYRKIAISVFIAFHFWAIITWVISPYSNLIMTEPESDHESDHFAGRFEKRIFTVIRAPENGFVSRLVGDYVNLIGAYQYWDFFAPHSARIHRYLSICRTIKEYPEDARIDCIEPIYRSFDGNPEHLEQSHDGKRSRSFRLVENLLRLHRAEFLDAFMLYWRPEHLARDFEPDYLLLHEFTLWPDGIHAKQTSNRRDEVIWILPN